MKEEVESAVGEKHRRPARPRWLAEPTPGAPRLGGLVNLDLRGHGRRALGSPLRGDRRVISATTSCALDAALTER